MLVEIVFISLIFCYKFSTYIAYYYHLPMTVIEIHDYMSPFAQFSATKTFIKYENS